MRPVTLTERAESRMARLDRTAGLIKGVRVLGERSENGRRYTQEAMRRAIPLYAGAAVFANHASPGRARLVEDRVGRLVNARVEGGAVVADLEYLKSHRLAPTLEEAAEGKSWALGLSHNVQGVEHHRNGECVIEDIRHVESVDLVALPATNKGLFEHRSGNMRSRRTWREIANRLEYGHFRVAKALKEMAEAGLLGVNGDTASGLSSEAPEDAGDGGDAAGAIEAAFRTAWGTIFDRGGDVAAKVKAARRLLTAMEKALSASDTGGMEESRPPLRGNLSESRPTEDEVKDLVRKYRNIR